MTIINEQDGYMIRTDWQARSAATMWNGTLFSHAVLCKHCVHPWGRHNEHHCFAQDWDDYCDCTGWEPMMAGAYSDYEPPPSMEPRSINAGGRALTRRHH